MYSFIQRQLSTCMRSFRRASPQLFTLLLTGILGLSVAGIASIRVQASTGAIDEYLYEWAVSFRGQPANEGSGNGIAVDSAGAVYTTGLFQGEFDFGGGQNPASVGQDDIFVAKLDGNGDYTWARSAGGSNQDEGKAIAVDNDGNVYTTGRFRLTADFNPGGNGGEVTSNGNDDIFIYRLNTDGSFGWVRSIGGSTVDEGWGIAVDNGANVYATGFFSGTVDFNPGPGQAELTSKDNTNDVFVVSLNGNGGFRWANYISGPSSRDRGNAVATDSNGNVYVTGYFDNSATDFNPQGAPATTRYAGNRDVFITKYNSSGAFQWVRSFGSGGSDAGNGIATDASGNIYVTGAFEEDIDVDGDGTIDLNGGSGNARDIFVVSYQPNGTFRWATSFSGPGRDEGNSISADANGNVSVAGYFVETISGGGFNLTSAGDNDAFVATLAASNGAAQSVAGVGGPGYDAGQGVAAGTSNAIFLTGPFSNQVDFDPSGESNALTSQGDQDVFVAKWTQESVEPPTGNKIYLPIIDQ